MAADDRRPRRRARAAARPRAARAGRRPSATRSRRCTGSCLLTPARLLGVALADAVGDRRAINQPGTYDEYPNWRIPLSDGLGQPLLLEDVMSSLRAQSLTRTVEGS